MSRLLTISTITLFLLAFTPAKSGDSLPLWGFFAHQKINRIAVFTLPPEMLPFYKKHISYITENAVNPDKRRYAVKDEAPRHYIDLDVYGDSALQLLPKYWHAAVEKFTEDTLKAYGIVPWHVHFISYQLTEAFKEKDERRILQLSADLGHYIADANVPLHTTENYNGQLTDQYGIHGFWESRLPELFSEEYDFFVGQARYINNTQLNIWEAVSDANNALDSVLTFEKELSDILRQDEKYSSEMRGNQNIIVYSRDFSTKYHSMLSGQVERQMRKAIKMVGDYWYTCWVNAGQPDLSTINDNSDIIFTRDSLGITDTTLILREHESGNVSEESK